MSPLTENLFSLVKLIELKEWDLAHGFISAMPDDDLIISYTTLHSIKQSPAHSVAATRAQKFVAGELSKRNSDDHPDDHQ